MGTGSHRADIKAGRNGAEGRYPQSTAAVNRRSNVQDEEAPGKPETSDDDLLYNVANRYAIGTASLTVINTSTDHNLYSDRHRVS